jgi:hypothetical protein
MTGRKLVSNLERKDPPLGERLGQKGIYSCPVEAIKF